MALERIDPVIQHDKWVLDHYARYMFTLSLASGMRVLDAACGTGFGSKMLAEARASSVVGIDLSQSAIDYACEHYAHEHVQYHCKDILALSAKEDGLFDLVVCFETLEHIVQAEAALDAFVQVTAPRGMFVVSVPNEIDRPTNNPYHLSNFSREHLLSLLGARFKNVTLYYQNFTAASIIWNASAPGAEYDERAAPAQHQAMLFKHGSDDADVAHPDCFVALCTNDAEPLMEAVMVHSGCVWRTYVDEFDRNWAELQKVGQSWKTQQSHITSQQTYIAELEQKRDQLWSELQEMGQSWKTQQSHITNQQARVTELEQEHDRLWNELQEVGQSWKTQQTHIGELEHAYQELLLDVQRIRDSWQAKLIFISQVQQERDRLWRELQEVGQSWEAQHSHIASQQTQIAELEQERDALRAERERVLSRRMLRLIDHIMPTRRSR